MAETEYRTYPAVDDDYNFPPEVRVAMANSTEFADKIQQAVVDKDPALFASYVQIATQQFLAGSKVVQTGTKGTSPLNDDDFSGARTTTRQRIKFLRFDKFGNPSLGAVRSMAKKGVLAVRSMGTTLATGAGARYVSELGQRTWLEIDNRGGPTKTAIWAIVNALHIYAGKNEPFVYSGNFVIWFKIDYSNQLSDVLLVQGV